MSGGSFDYLCFQEPPDREGLARMAAELETLHDEGIHGADALAALTRRAHDLHYDHPLRWVWHAIEWWQSNDWSREQAIEAVRDYFEKHPTYMTTIHVDKAAIAAKDMPVRVNEWTHDGLVLGDWNVWAATCKGAFEIKTNYANPLLVPDGNGGHHPVSVWIETYDEVKRS